MGNLWSTRHTAKEICVCLKIWNLLIRRATLQLKQKRKGACIIYIMVITLLMWLGGMDAVILMHSVFMILNQSRDVFINHRQCTRHLRPIILLYAALCRAFSIITLKVFRHPTTTVI